MSDIVYEASALQHKAASPLHSVWVSANAGTGKTRVLTDRFLRLLLADETLLPGEVLALTFTKAAAQEMGERLRKRVLPWQIIDQQQLKLEIAQLEGSKVEEVDAKKLERARALVDAVLDAPHGLNIMTLHAFCQKVLGRFPLESGFLPGFEVMEDDESRRLLYQAQDYVFATLEGLESEGSFAHLAALWGEGVLRDNLQAVTENAQRYRKLFKKYGSLAGVCGHLATTLDVPAKVTPAYWEEHKLKLINLNDALKQELASVAKKLGRGGARSQKYSLIINSYIVASEQHLGAAWQSLNSVFYDSKQNPRPAAKIADKQVVKQCDESVLAQIEEVQQHVVAINEKLKAGWSYVTTCAWLDLGQAILQTYEKLKQEQNRLDFNDLIATTEKLLKNEDYGAWVRFRLDHQIRHILLDEGQDIDGEQWAIIEAVATEFFGGEGVHDLPRTLFAVGDLKQSIYRFRGAQPQTFGAIEGFLEQNTAHLENASRTVRMQTTFRSSEPILRLVDAVFANEQKAAAAGEMSVSHTSAHPNRPGWVELWPCLDKPETNKKEADPWPLPAWKPAKTSPKQQLAAKVAKSVRGLLDTQPVLSSTGKKVAAEDIMILLRNRTMMGEMVQALEKEGVAHSGQDRLELLNHPIGQDMLALGRFLVSPDDDLSLAQALRSPLFNMTDDDLARVASARSGSLWQSLYARRQEFSTIVNVFEALLAQVDYASPYTIYNMALELTNARGKFLARLGQKSGPDTLPMVNEPLDAFLAKVFTYSDLRLFVHEFARYGLTVKRETASAKGVRLLTVHSAKGLEAPIVYLPDTAQDFYAGLTREVALWQTDEKMNDNLCLVRSTKAGTSQYQSKLEEKEKQNLFADEMRLLYVALTRAEERLYIGGLHVPDDKMENTWYGHVRAAMQQMGDVKVCGNGLLLHQPCHAPLPIAEQVQYAQPSSQQEEYLLHAPGHRAVVKRQRASDTAELDLTFATPEQEYLYVKGKLIHRLLEVLPRYNKNEQKQKALHFLEQKGQEPYEHEQLWAQVNAVLELYPELFETETSRAEVALVAEDEKGNVLEGVVDRLVVTAEQVSIIDFKTNAIVPEQVPKAYTAQLAFYRKLAARLWPDKTIRTALLWTSVEGANNAPAPLLQWVGENEKAQQEQYRLAL